MSSLFNISADY